MTIKNPRWETMKNVGFGVAALLLIANIARLYMASNHTVSAQTIYPYTVIRTETVYDQFGKARLTHRYMEAVRSDGSKMWKGSTQEVQQRQVYFANGDEVRMNELAARKSTFTGASSGPAEQRSPMNSCLTSDNIKAGLRPDGTESVAGHKAIRVMSTQAKRTMTYWFAIDEGCALIRQRFEHETGVTEQNLSGIFAGEPDAGLFMIPFAFQEVLPSALFSCADPGRTCKTPVPDAMREKMDRRYLQLNAKKL
jgi:hypothetical protein